MKEKMKVGAAIKKAVSENDTKLAINIAEQLRIYRGWTYTKIYDFVHSHTGVSAADWEALLQEEYEK